MITINKLPGHTGYVTDIPSQLALDFRGLSTDLKPDAPNGSSFLEIDTGKVFCYDKEHKTWVAW